MSSTPKQTIPDIEDEGATLIQKVTEELDGRLKFFTLTFINDNI